MRDRQKISELGFMYLVLGIVLLLVITSCALNKTSITGFAAKDDKGKTAN